MSFDCGVLNGGFWKLPGFASLNGIVATTSHDNSKVIYAVVLSKFCKVVKYGKKRKGQLLMSSGNAHTIVR